MPKYKVTGHMAMIGVGMILKLSKSQASIRVLSLKQKSKDTYIVLEPVQFKQGEEIIIVSGNVSKSLLNNLIDLSEDKKSEDKKSTNNKQSSSKNQNKNNAKKSESESNGLINAPHNIDEAVVDNSDINNLPNV